MFPFGNSDQNTQMPILSGLEQFYPLFMPQPPQDQQKTLENLKSQTDYLVSQVNGIKQVLSEFILEVRGKLTHITENVAQLQRAAQMERPRKKFKKAIMCPHEDCGRKYSSKIALNCHLRTKHNGKKQ